jgi:ABC-type multidrug transport system ATPase subunit
MNGCRRLDPRGKTEIFDQIDKLHQEENLTVVLVSHSMEDVASRAKHLLVLADGQIKLQGTPAEVFTDAAMLENLGLALPQMTYADASPAASRDKDVPTDIFSVLLPVMRFCVCWRCSKYEYAKKYHYRTVCTGRFTAAQLRCPG